tara:strand:- start:236 stop:424 length:189 start_codon:yes stop_codon:yes gene_type:complete
MIAKGNVKIGLEWRFGPEWPGQRCGAKTAVRLCQDIANGRADLIELNRQSLIWRKKQRLIHK